MLGIGGETVWPRISLMLGHHALTASGDDSIQAAVAVIIRPITYGLTE
jgi:hypothetical protein